MTYATRKTLNSRRDISTAEAADLLGCSERTIRNMIEAGELKAYRLTPADQSHYRIPRLQIESILSARRLAAQRRK